MVLNCCWRRLLESLGCHGLCRPGPGDCSRQEEGCRGPKSQVEQGCFICRNACLYIFIQGSFQFSSVQLLSRVWLCDPMNSFAQSCPTLYDPMVHRASLSMEFSRQEHWNGLPFPPPGDLPDPGIKLQSLSSPALAGGFFPLNCMGRPGNLLKQLLFPNCYIVPLNDIENLGIFHILFQ